MEVHDHDEGKIAIGRNGRKKLFQRLLPSGGSADTDDEAPGPGGKAVATLRIGMWGVPLRGWSAAVVIRRGVDFFSSHGFLDING